MLHRERSRETEMKGSAIGMLAAGCLVVGFGAGFVARPMISPGGSSAAAAAAVAQPTEEEAIALIDARAAKGPAKGKKKAPAKKAAAKKTPTKKAPAKKTPAKKAAPAE